MIVYGMHLIFTEDFASEHHCFAMRYSGDALQIGVVDGISDKEVIAAEAHHRGVNELEFIPLSLNEVKRMIYCYYSIELKNKEIYDRLRLLGNEERYEELFLYILKKAMDFSSSDIHIQAEEPYLMIRFRIRGRLVTFCVLEQKLLPIIGRIIKVKGNVDIARSLRPIDARMEIDLAEKLDIRLSIVNTIQGEKYSLRLLNNENVPRSIEELGIDEVEIHQIRNRLLRESGAVLVTGPTGSGKSTTVRCFLEEINDGRNHIISIEDPIEYHMQGVTQIQVDERTHNGFEEGVKSILRQDPDIIFIGEIRDEVSAEIAMKASITGHLVFSTLHTKSAELAIERLENLKQDRDLILEAVTMIINQRLIGEQCEACKREVKYLGEEISALNLKKGDRILESKGCAHCDYSGVSRRVPIISMVEVKSKELEYFSEQDRSIQSKVISRFQKGKLSLEEARRFL